MNKVSNEKRSGLDRRKSPRHYFTDKKGERRINPVDDSSTPEKPDNV